MYLAYSALNHQTEQSTQQLYFPDNEVRIRYQAYQETCNKYSTHIAEIQKYFPNWSPQFR